MVDAVEHIGLHRGVVYHVLKDDSFAYLQLVVEAPISHVVSTEARISSQTIGIGALSAHFRTPDGWLVGHFQAIGHVAREADVQDGGAYAAVLHNVHHFGCKHPGLPGEGRARLKDDAQVGITPVQALQQADEVFYILILAGHQMAAAQVQPFQLGEPSGELGYQMRQSMLQGIGG